MLEAFNLLEALNLSLKSTPGYNFLESLNWDTKKVSEELELNFANWFGKHLVVAKCSAVQCSAVRRTVLVWQKREDLDGLAKVYNNGFLRLKPRIQIHLFLLYFIHCNILLDVIEKVSFCRSNWLEKGHFFLVRPVYQLVYTTTVWCSVV